MGAKKVLFVYCCILHLLANASTNPHELVYNDPSEIVRAGYYLGVLEDPTNQLTITDVEDLKNFKNYNRRIPRFGISKSTFWAKVIITNKTDLEDFILKYNKIDVEELAVFYKVNPSDLTYSEKRLNAYSKKFSGRLFLFDLKIPENESRTVYIKFKTKWNVTFSIEIAAKQRIMDQIFNQELISGIYFGILLIMVLYNMFIYFSVKDRSYLFYVIYISFFLLFQFNELGYAYKYLWYKYPPLYSVTAKLFPILTTIAAFFFFRDFLKTKTYTPKLDRCYDVLLVFLVATLSLVFYQKHNSLAFSVINIITLVASIFTLFVAIIIVNKGFKPARFFLIAWAILLTSIIEFNLSNLGVIPYYPITDHALEIGSSIEVVLLSLGLANRINVLKKEKEESQAKALQLAKEKKNIIQNQNVALEKLVIERTKKLELKNKTISEKNEEKSIMMREIHHRVKNNLQMINSMIRLQSRFVNDETSIDVLKKVQRRILTMAHLHEKMYQSENLKQINIKDYITYIVEDLFQIYKSDGEITYELELIDANYKMETILYIGLLLSELIINALKHAFPENGDKGKIYIALKDLGHDTYQLKVADNGKGIDINSFYESNSLGQRLIKNFVKQLKGELIINKNKGTEFLIIFEEH